MNVVKTPIAILPTILRAAALLLSLTGLVTPAAAASFDCTKARNPDEIAVCKYRNLSELDREMGGLWYAYAAFPFLMGANGARQDEAHDFLEKRKACGADSACLQAAYTARIAKLKSDITSAMKTFCHE
jgi:uncharacterized protein